MGSRQEIPVYIAFAASIVLAAFQGGRVNALRESEGFYAWIINAAAQSQFGTTLQFDQSLDVNSKDDEFFARVNERAETQLPKDLAIDAATDYDRKDALRPLLVRYASRSLDDPIWKFARDPENQDLRDAFYDLASNNQLQSLGTQLTAGDLYIHQVQGVGVTSMFLGFRQLAANFVWLQVDRYWHEGQVHRMVPLMRTCVTLDPHFVDAFLVGAWHMAYNVTANLDDTPERDKTLHPKYKKRLGEKEEWYYIAIDYLRDGIRKNPRDYRLYFDLGYEIYEIKLEDHANAVRYLREARKYRHERWVPRMLFRALTKNGEYEESIEGWKEYLKTFPNSDTALTSIRENEAFIAEARFDDFLNCVDAAQAFADAKFADADAAELSGDAPRAALLRQEAGQAQSDAEAMRESSAAEKEQALQIWGELKEQGSTLAQARILRMGAVEAVSEGRYIEAIAELEAARFNHLEFFEEATNMILDIKLAHGATSPGLNLEVSEELMLERRNEAAMYAQDESGRPVIRRVECKYIASETAANAG